MKELELFTVEQLNNFIESDHAQCGDVAALARIALSAKQAVPVTEFYDTPATNTLDSNQSACEYKKFEAFMAQRFGELIDQRRCLNGDGNDYMAWDMQVAKIVWMHFTSKLEAERQRTAEITDQYVDRATALSFATQRAEAAEARLLVPVKLPDDGLEDCINMWPDNWRNDFDTGYNFGVWRCEQNIKSAGYPVEGGNTATIAPAPEGVVMRPPFEKPLERCAAARDGECSHKECPQLRDNEPMATGRHCPIDNWDE